MNNTTKPTIFAVTRCFLKLGVQGFGGLGAVLALLTHDLVERRGWLCEAEVTEALTYTKFLPGSTIVQVVAYLGWKLHGFFGALAATVAFLLPTFLMMLFLALNYHSLTLLPGISAAIAGLTAVVVSLLVLATWTLGRKNITKFSGMIVALVTLIASVSYEVNPALLVLVAGLLGVLTEARK